MFSNFLVRFDRFVPMSSNSRAACSEVLKFSSLFRSVCFFFSPFGAVCSLLWNSRVSFERFALVVKVTSLFRAVCPLFLNFLVPFERFACSLSSNFLICLERFAPGVLKFLVPFKQFVPCSQIL